MLLDGATALVTGGTRGIGRALAADLAAQSEAELAANLGGLLPALCARPESRIVFVTSVLALAPKASAPVYCATKAALRSLAASLRVALAPHRVGVSDAMPPLVDTDMTADRGARKSAPGAVAAAIVRGVEADRDEIPIGAARALRVLHRWWPGLVARRMIRQ